MIKLSEYCWWQESCDTNVDLPFGEGREVWVITVMHHSEHSRRPTRSGHLFAHRTSDYYATGALMGEGFYCNK